MYGHDIQTCENKEIHLTVFTKLIFHKQMTSEIYTRVHEGLDKIDSILRKIGHLGITIRQIIEVPTCDTVAEDILDTLSHFRHPKTI